MKAMKYIHSIIYRLAAFILTSILYMVFFPYTSFLAIVGLVFFMLKGDFITESRLERFSDWFNKIAVYISKE